MTTAAEPAVKRYAVPVYRVALVRDSTIPADAEPMANPGKVAAVVRDYLADVDREHFVVLLLDAKSRIIGINTVAVGTLDGAPVHPREVFKAAVLANAACVIVAHNHPSGDPTPSPQDRAVTRLLQRAGDAMRIPVLDHVIVTADGASFSFATEAQAAGAVA